MNHKCWRMVAGLLLCGMLGAQIPSGMDLQSLKQMLANQTGTTLAPSTTPAPAQVVPLTANPQADQAIPPAKEDRLDQEIRALKAREHGPARFAADLFTVRQHGSFATDGGISDDYVLGTGDQLAVNVFGSATFDLPAQVDGRGQIVIPKVGTVRVGGLTLGQARKAVQARVAQDFSHSTVDLQVTRMREIRVFVQGEVYLPGAYLVPSLSSLINVLSLAGGPTALGSYRDIRVMRGGKEVFHFDLYPYRAEGLGNPNVTLQSGDTIFVPLVENQVMLRGAFERVVGEADLQAPRAGAGMRGITQEPRDPVQEQLDILLAQRKALLAIVNPQGLPENAGNPPNGASLPVQPPAQLPAFLLGKQGSQRDTSKPAGQQDQVAQPQGALPPILPPETLAAIQTQLQLLDAQIKPLEARQASDHRLQLDPVTNLPYHAADGSLPRWLRRWYKSGVSPEMAFEMRPGETVADALRFAGGLALEAGPGALTLERHTLAGVVTGQEVRLSQAASVPLQRGDVLSALPQRTLTGAVVQVSGWAQVPGFFARTPGLKVGDLLRQEHEILPDTYQPRGEIVRTLPDGSTRYFAFDVAKALAGDPASDLLLADRDKVELYRVEDFRLPRTVTVLGPVTRPGVYAFHEGMRASDLIFRAGIPLKSANDLVAELAHCKAGKPTQIIRLDLKRLLSTRTESPVGLDNDALNPRLQPDDQLSFFSLPDAKISRIVHLEGQVEMPGDYVLESDHETLSHLIARAGGLTANAMPQAGVFLRQMGEANSSLMEASRESGLAAKDPTANGINEILQRLNETKRNPLTGALEHNPILHDLAAGSLNRMVVNFPAALKGDSEADVELRNEDRIIIPRKMDSAYVVGETASPFANYKVGKGMKVRDLLKLAGGTTRNADTWNIRLLKADGRIVDSWVMGQKVEPGDTVLVPQRFRRDTNWQENLQALTPLALLLNAIRLN